MCGSKPKVPKIKPVTPPPVPPPPSPPEPSPEAPVLNSERKKDKTDNRLRNARRKGTRGLRIDLLIPGPGSGLNIPT